LPNPICNILLYYAVKGKKAVCMDTLLIIATRDGLYVCEHQNGEWRPVRYGLAGENVTSAIAREGVILAGTRHGVFRSDDLGQSWAKASQGLATPIVRWMAYHPDISDFEFAGTEPAGIFISHDGAKSWRACPEVEQLRDAHGWSLPYSPEAGCVRGFTFHGARAYAAVEVGGVLVSDDRGETWRLARGSEFSSSYPPPGSVHPDVHSLQVHASSRDLVYAPTGGGFYRSWDGSKTWELRYRCYCRAVWVDPIDPDHLVLGPADGVDSNGRIESSLDGGRTWRGASSGLDTPWRRHMVERFTQVGNELMAVLSDGELLSATVDVLEWRAILREVSGVNAVTSIG
jgi:photosystem II stability/assembly factor-like uncharacterized protein